MLIVVAKTSRADSQSVHSKLIELNMVGDDSKKYKISFVLDRHPMFSVWSTRYGKPFKHEVKVSE